MPSFSPSLPLEIIQLILFYLPRKYLFQLLQRPPNHDWLYATASIVYRHLNLTHPYRLRACQNLFEQTRKRRQHSDRPGFYSTINYSVLVRRIDLSKLAKKELVTDRLLTSLTMDCVHLRQINLYNCHALTNASLMTLLQQCPQLEQLSLAGAYTITVSCFLDKQILCPQLRTLNLKMLPGFFCLSSPQKRWSSAPFPKLQELKLGDNYINNELPNLLALLLQRCANITRLSVDSLQYNPLIPKSLRPKALDICLDQVPHLTWVTLCKFIFQPGTLTQLLTSRKLERLELECIDVRTLNELEVGDYSRLTGLKLSPMIVPPGLLTRIISAAPLLTRINCLHIDDDAWTILKNYPLTHLTTSRLPALDYLTAWQNSLVWLEIKGVKQVHKYSVVDFLCTWDNHIQVLLLDGFNLTTTDLQRLARSFTHTRYLSFNAEGTDNTAEDVELALRDWTCLKGVLCANEEELMAENDETWLDWECMDAWRTQFFRWEQKDQIS